MTKQEIDIYVGKRLRMRRTLMGLSQEAAAKAVGITFQQVQKYEKGVNAMNAKRLVEFARFMNVPVAYFFDGLETNKFEIKNEINDFAEDLANFEYKTPSNRESLEMMKAFKRIGKQGVRKKLSDLVRAIADEKIFIDK